MSLRESARRMYTAQYSGGNAKRKIATQYLEQLPGAIEKIATNVESKREEAANEWGKKRQSTLDQVKNNPEARAKFAEELDAMKNRYDAAVRKSTGPFAGKKKKQDAANELAAINSEIKAFQEDLANFDAIMSTKGTYSKGNTIGNSADNAWVYSDESTKNFEFREDGVYVTQPSTGNEIKLRDFKQPLMVWDEGIEDAGKMLTKVGSSATSNTPWPNVEKMLVGQANTLMNDKRKFKSLIFDDILDFNFAAENYPDEDLNVLKERYDTDPEFQKEMMSKWKEAYVAEGKEMYDITGAKDDEKESKESGAKDIKTYPVYTYNTQGTYMGATQKTADEVRSMFDIKSGNFSFGKRRVEVKAGSRGRIWQIYDISGKEPVGEVYYKLEDVLNDLAPYAAKATTNDPFDPNN
jgi:hypothetical protein